MSCPSNVTVPSVRSYSRITQRPNVDLPQPDSPTSPTVSPPNRSRLTPSTACTRATSRWISVPSLIGKYFLTSRAESSGSPPPFSLTPTPRPAARRREPRSCCFCSTVRKQASRCSRRPRASSIGSSVAAVERVRAARRGTRQPAGSASIDGGWPGIVESRRDLGRSSRGIEPSSPHVYGCCGLRNTRASCPARPSGPAYITTTRSAMSATTPMSCVIRTMAESNSWRSRLISSRICAWIVTSSAVVGSSAISRSGLHDRPMAIITRWRMPPENWCG